MSTSTDGMIVYGADWCHVTQEKLAHLDEVGAPYHYVDVEADPDAAAWVRDQNNGMEIKPTIRIGEVVLTAPADGELDRVLRERGLLT